MPSGSRRALLFGVALAFALSVVLPGGAALPTTGRSASGAPEESMRRDRQEEQVLTVREAQGSKAAAGKGAAAARSEMVTGVGVHRAGKSGGQESEIYSIHAIDTPFKLSPGEQEGSGIVVTALGEPKSGTTWLARVVVELCVQLCGNPENTWCKMGGLKITNNKPAPWYELEMLHAATDEPFLHFQGSLKHEIPGLGKRGCIGDMLVHPNRFGNQYPCKSGGDLSRGGLVACLPAVTPECAFHLSPLDPARQRMAVIFRDARDLIISEHRMRRHVFQEDIADLEPFILARFRIVVAWIHQRFLWHTTALEQISHVMFYEDLQTFPHHLADLAAFLGLDCTPAEAADVFKRHSYASPPGDYTTYGISTETLEWMNTTMSKKLPEAMLIRYGLTPTWE